MERFEFYKEQYFKEEDRKNEINNSLSLPLGVISGFVATLFYLLTTFDFKTNKTTNVIFLIVIGIATLTLLISIYHLIKAYTNFHNGYGYDFLPDAKDLNKYFVDLDKYYQENPQHENISSKEFNDYVLKCLVDTTDKNQKNNKMKSFHRYLSLKHLINSFLVILVILIPYGYNYCNKEKPKETMSIEIMNMKNLIDSINVSNFKPSKINNMIDEKPTPPPTQTIKEGQDPTIKR